MTAPVYVADPPTTDRFGVEFSSELTSAAADAGEPSLNGVTIGAA